MRAAVIVDGRLEVQERPDPVPGDGEILIRVRAAGVNGADLCSAPATTPRRTVRRPTSPGWNAQGKQSAASP